MKKVLFFVAAVTFTAGTMVSCGKSTKGKMDAEWTIDSFVEKSTNTSTSGNTSTETVEYSGGKKTTTNVAGGVTTKDVATLNEAKWDIKKDGTWERTVSYTEIDTNEILGTQYIVTSNITSIESGNWDFLNGVGEFKKNERVSFSTMSSKTTNNSTTKNSSNGTTTTSTNSYTNSYADGESAEIYVIEESKKKALTLKFTGSSNSTHTSGSGSTTTKYTTDKTYTLSSN